jgi:hypothetical protein
VTAAGVLKEFHEQKPKGNTIKGGGEKNKNKALLGNVSTTSSDLAASLAPPDADSNALHRVLAAERASVSGMLRDLKLLDLLPQRSTITGSVFTNNSDLLSALALRELSEKT